MNTTNNGGPAFPSAGDGNETWANDGMPLRDYFAAKAMQMHGQGLADVRVESEEAWDALVSARAYKTADAMLAAREAAK